MNTCVDETAQPIAVSLPVGDTFLLQVDLTDEDRQPVDVTGWTWESQLFDADGAVVTDIEVIVINPAAGGVVEMTTDTDGLPLADYTFNLRATDTDDDDKTLFDGKLRIKAATT